MSYLSKHEWEQQQRRKALRAACLEILGGAVIGLCLAYMFFMGVPT